MAILTKRNALIGWLTLIVGRRVAKRKAKRKLHGFSPRRRLSTR